jgi:hypothetical protein
MIQVRSVLAVLPAPFLSATLVGILFVCGCRKKSSDSNAPNERLSHQTGVGVTNTTTAQIQAAEDLVKSGAIDEGAARLVQIQAARPDFSPKEAAQYRQAMADAYTRALEGAQKGDPRAQAALQLLRVARPK